MTTKKILTLKITNYFCLFITTLACFVAHGSKLICGNIVFFIVAIVFYLITCSTCLKVETLEWQRIKGWAIPLEG